MWIHYSYSCFIINDFWSGGAQILLSILMCVRFCVRLLKFCWRVLIGRIYTDVIQPDCYTKFLFIKLCKILAGCSSIDISRWDHHTKMFGDSQAFWTTRDFPLWVAVGLKNCFGVYSCIMTTSIFLVLPYSHSITQLD